MAERKRAQEVRDETGELPGAQGNVSQQGREGGRLAREIGSRDEQKRATERPAGTTRVTKKDEADRKDEEG